MYYISAVIHLFQPFWCWDRNILAELVNNMAANALAPCFTRSSTAMLLSMQNKCVLIFHRERFQLPVLYWCQEMIGNPDTKLFFPNKLICTPLRYDCSVTVTIIRMFSISDVNRDLDQGQPECVHLRWAVGSVPGGAVFINTMGGTHTGVGGKSMESYEMSVSLTHWSLGYVAVIFRDAPLTLYVVNFSEGTQTYIYILCHYSTLIFHRYLKSFLM